MKKFTEALSTPCQTPDMVYDINISDDKIDISLNMPFKLDIDEDEAKLLEKNLHNAIELVMKKYF
jgi:hypothetical protein